MESYHCVRVQADTSYYEARIKIKNGKMYFLECRKVQILKNFETLCQVDGYNQGIQITDPRNFIKSLINLKI